MCPALTATVSNTAPATRPWNSLKLCMPFSCKHVACECGLSMCLRCEPQRHSREQNLGPRPASYKVFCITGSSDGPTMIRFDFHFEKSEPECRWLFAPIFLECETSYYIAPLPRSQTTYTSLSRILVVSTTITLERRFLTCFIIPHSSDAVLICHSRPVAALLCVPRHALGRCASPPPVRRYQPQAT